MDTIEKAPLTAADLLPCDLDLTTPLKDLPLSSDFMFAEVQEAVKTARNDPRLEVPYMTYQQKMRDIAKDYTERGRLAGFEEGIEQGIENLILEYQLLGQSEATTAQALIRRYGLVLPVAEDKVRKYWKS